MGGFHSPMDIFDMFFGTGHGRHRGRQERKGKDMIHQLKVMFKPLICVHEYTIFSQFS